MNAFSFATAADIRFGEGVAKEAGKLARGLGRDAFVVTGRDARRAAAVLDSLAAESVNVTIFQTPGEPEFGTVTEALAAAKAALENAALPDIAGKRPTAAPAARIVVVGVGGGSALDLAKAVGILLTNPGDALDYAERIGGGRLFTESSAPVVAVPTTAGTGSEVTRNAVISEPALKIKISLRSPLMLPRIALVDPELCHGLPARQTADSGMDALTQVLEPLVSLKANPLADALCRAALPRAARALPAAVAAARRGDRPDEAGRAARREMSFVSLCGGLVLANAGLGAVHGLAAPLGGAFPVPHGAACAALLGPVCRANVAALKARGDEAGRAHCGRLLARYAEAARALTGDGSAGPEKLADFLDALAEELEIRPLSSFGVSRSDIPAIVSAAQGSNSMKANPVPLRDEELALALDLAI